MATKPLLLRGGWLPSPGGLKQADVLIGSSGHITAVGAGLAVGVAEEILVDGDVVVPGFIDAHAHAEVVLLDEPVHRAATSQGVTTYLLGQDGTSVAPSAGPRQAELDQYFAAVNGRSGEASRACTVADWLDLYERASSVNVGVFVPNGNLRLEALGWEARSASGEELSRMRTRLSEALAQGALGLSSGLDYVPSAHASVQEQIALCEVVAAHGKVYVTHMRGYGRNVAVGMREVVAVARATGVKVHISHFSGTVEQVLPHIDRALNDGIDVTFDTYPYTSSQTLLAMLAVPPHFFEGGPDQFLREAETPRGRERLLVAINDRMASRFEQLVLSHATDSAFALAVGRPLADVAAERGQSPAETTVDLLLSCDLACSVVVRRTTFTDEDVREVRRHRAHMTGSDGIFVGQRPHPRGWATFARIARDQLEGSTGWSWPEFVGHTSGAAAERFGLVGRGTLDVGAIADVIVLGAVRPVADFQRPRTPAEGLQLAVVGGVPVFRAGVYTGARPGRSVAVPSSSPSNDA